MEKKLEFTPKRWELEDLKFLSSTYQTGVAALEAENERLQREVMVLKERNKRINEQLKSIKDAPMVDPEPVSIKKAARLLVTAIKNRIKRQFLS